MEHVFPHLLCLFNVYQSLMCATFYSFVFSFFVCVRLCEYVYSMCVCICVCILMCVDVCVRLCIYLLLCLFHLNHCLPLLLFLYFYDLTSSSLHLFQLSFSCVWSHPWCCLNNIKHEWSVHTLMSKKMCPITTVCVLHKVIHVADRANY